MLSNRTLCASDHRRRYIKSSRTSAKRYFKKVNKLLQRLLPSPESQFDPQARHCCTKHRFPLYLYPSLFNPPRSLTITGTMSENPKVKRARDTLSELYSFYQANRDSVLSNSSGNILIGLDLTPVPPPAAEKVKELKENLGELAKDEEVIQGVPADLLQIMVAVATTSSLKRGGKHELELMLAAAESSSLRRAGGKKKE